MAGKKVAEYAIGIEYQVDPKGLQQVITDLKSLNSVQYQNIHVGVSTEEANKKLEQFRHTLTDVQRALNQSYDVKLNTYDIDKFVNSYGKALPNIFKELKEGGAAGEKAMIQMVKAFSAANVPLKENYQLLDKIGETFANTIRWQIATRAIFGVTGAIQSAIYFTKDLDRSLNNIRIVTEKSAHEMDLFAQKANQVAKSLGKSTTDYTNASLIFYQQGLSDKEVAARTETTLKASNVTGQSASAVSEQLTAVWNGYQIGLGQTEAAVDKLAAVAAMSASNLEELSTAMSKVAATANMTGVDIDQLNAQISTIISVTRQAPETVGTALKTIYARISDLKLGETDEDGLGLGDVSETLHKVGIEVLDETGNLRDMGTVIEEIAEKWNYLSRGERTALAEVMGGKRQYTNLVALFDNWDKYNKALETSRNSLGTLQKQQDTYMDSIKALQQRVSTAKEELYLSIMDPDTLKDVNQGLLSILEKVTKIIKTIGGGKGLLTTIISVLSLAMKAPLAKGLTTVFNNMNASTQTKEAIAYTKRRTEIIAKGFGEETGPAKQFNKNINTYTEQLQTNKITIDQYNRLTKAAENYANAQADFQEKTEYNNNVQEQYQKLLGEELKFTTDLDKEQSIEKTSNKIQELAKEIEDTKIKLGEIQNFKENPVKEPSASPKYHLGRKNSEDYLAKEKKNIEKLVNTELPKIENLVLDNINIGDINQATVENLISTLKNKLKGLQKNKKRGYKDEKAKAKNAEQIEYVENILSKLEDTENKRADRVAANAQKTEAFKKQREEYAQQLADYNKQLEVQKYNEEELQGILQEKEEIVKKLLAIQEQINEAETTEDEERNTVEQEHILNLEEENAAREQMSRGLADVATGIMTTVTAASQLSETFNSIANGEADVMGATLSLITMGPILVKGISSIRGGLSALSGSLTTFLGTTKAAIFTIGAFAAAAAVAFIAISAITKARKEQQEADERAAQAAQENFEAAKERADSAKEEADNIEELNKSYRDLLKTAEEVQYSQEDLTTATEDLVKQYNQEAIYLGVLTGKYLDYKDAIKQVTEEKEKQALKDAENAKKEAINSMATTVASTKIQSNFSEGVFSGKWGISDEQQDRLAKLLGLSGGSEFRSLDSKKLAKIISENRDTVENFVQHQISFMGTSTKFTDALSKYLEQTKDEQDAISELNQTIIDINDRGELRKIFGDSTMSSEERLKQVEKIAKKSNTSTTAIYTDYSTIEQYNRDTLENSDYAKQLGLDVSQLSDSEVKNYMQTMQNSVKLTKEQTDALIKAKNTYDDYTNSIDAATNAMKGFADWDFTTRISDESILKRALGLDEDENIPKEFEDYLKTIGTDLNGFYKNYSQDAQDNILRNYAKTSRELAEADLEAAKKAKEELPSQIEDTKNKLAQAQEDFDYESSRLESFKNANAQTIEYAQKSLKAYFESEGFTPDDADAEILNKNAKELTGEELNILKEILADFKTDDNSLAGVSLSGLIDIDGAQKKVDKAKKIRDDYLETLETSEKEYNKAIKDLEPPDYKAVYASFIKELEEANQAIDNLQSAYSSLNDVVETYNETGELSLDQAQQLATMDGQYLAALTMTDEGLQVETKQLEELTRAQVEKAKLDIIAAADAEIHEIATKGVSYALAEASLAASLYNNELAGTPEKTQAAIEATNNYIQSLDGLSAKQRDAINKVIEDRDRRLKIYDNVGLTSGSLLDSGNKSKEKSKDLVEAELDIYHDINIELKKIEREIDRINDKREKLLGQDLYNSYTQELGALEAQEGAVTRLLALQRKDAAEKRAELAANGVMFDANGEVSNYNAIKQKWTDQVNANPDNEALSKRRDELEELLSGYEELWDEKIPDTVDQLTDVANAKIEAAVNRFNLHMDVTLDLTEMKRAFNEFKRDFIDKTRSDDFSKFIETLTENMKLSYKAMDENVKHVNEIQAEIEKIRAGQNSDIYGDNLAKAVEDLENYNEKLKDEMKSVTEDLTSANEKYAESIDKLTEAYAKQQEYLEKLSQNYEDNAKLMQLLYGENNSGVAGMLDQQANTLALSAQKYRAEADRYEVEIAKIQARLADSSLTTETRQALEEEFQTLQDASLEAINNAAAASVAAIEKANEAFEATVKGSTYDMATKLLGEDFDTFKADWEATQHYAELYYDDINKAFEVQKLMNKYQKTLNDLTGTAQAKLRQAYDAELAHLKEKDKLTKYDIERAQKKYDLLVAQIALEEAQQNKNTLQLVRDSQGNYNYQYTADASAVADAQEKVDNLQQELYNLDQEAWKENTEAIMNETETISDKVTESYIRQNQQIKKVQDNENLSEEEKLKKIAEITDAETNIRQKYYDKLNALTRERVDIAKHAEEDTEDIVEQYAITLEDNYMPRLFATWENTNNLIGKDGGRVAELINQSQQTISDKNNVVTKLIEDNGTKAANAYQKIDDKIQKVLIPTQDDYIKKMDEEVTETNKVAEAIEQLAQNYQKLYGEAGTAAEKTTELIELCKQFQELQDKTVTYTVDYKVTGNPEAAKGMQDLGDGSGGKFGNLANNMGEGLTSSPTALSNSMMQVSKDISNSNAAVASATSVDLNDGKYGYSFDYWSSESYPSISYGDIFDANNDVSLLSGLVSKLSGGQKSHRGYVKVTKDGAGIGYLPIGDFLLHFARKFYPVAGYTDRTSGASVFIDPETGGKDTVYGAEKYSSMMLQYRKKILSESLAFKSGGYTGDWGDSGRWALLHQKELVLNSVDTANLLETIKYQREISQMQMAAAATSEKTPSAMTANGQLDQNVYIEASFPGVQNANEIEAALNNLVNAAAQRANSNLL